jgi:hypothetical protein
MLSFEEGEEVQKLARAKVRLFEPNLAKLQYYAIYCNSAGR